MKILQLQALPEAIQQLHQRPYLVFQHPSQAPMTAFGPGRALVPAEVEIVDFAVEAIGMVLGETHDVTTLLRSRTVPLMPMLERVAFQLPGRQPAYCFMLFDAKPGARKITFMRSLLRDTAAFASGIVAEAVHALQWKDITDPPWDAANPDVHMLWRAECELEAHTIQRGFNETWSTMIAQDQSIGAERQGLINRLAGITADLESCVLRENREIRDRILAKKK